MCPQNPIPSESATLDPAQTAGGGPENPNQPDASMATYPLSATAGLEFPRSSLGLACQGWDGVMPRPVRSDDEGHRPGEAARFLPFPAAERPEMTGRPWSATNGFGSVRSDQNSSSRLLADAPAPRAMTWSRHSRRIEPTSLSTKAFRQELWGAIITCSISLLLTRSRKDCP